ncbi:hypothetical protein RCL1_008603 [Eukaryota sp. TZLM3-RCL]
MHNVLIQSNGLTFFIKSQPLLDDSPNADYLQSLLEDVFVEMDNIVQPSNLPLMEKCEGTIDEQTSNEHGTPLLTIRWITIDGAKVNTKTCTNIQTGRPTVLWCKCLAHTLSLLLKDFSKLSWINDLFRSIKDLHKVFKNISKTRHWYLESGGKELQSFAVTRFAYVILLLQHVQTSRSAMVGVVESLRYLQLSKKSKKLDRRHSFLSPF